MSKDQEFLQKLKAEAEWQRGLQNEQLIPNGLGALASFVAQHTWKVLLSLAILSSILWELFIYQGGKI